MILAVPAMVLVRFAAAGHLGATLRELLVAAPLLAAAMSGQMYVAYRNSRRTRPRSRKEYLLGSLGFGVLALVALGLGYAAQDHLHLLAQALLIASACCFFYALALFARGAFRGRLRRQFWYYPPWWAFDGTASDETAPGAPDVMAPSPGQSQARPPAAAGVVDHSARAAFIREQPLPHAHTGASQHRKARSGRYEVICIACGDNPDLDCSDVPAAIQQVRGPYPTFDMARDALRQHLKLLANR